MKAGRERSGQCLGFVSEAEGRLADAFKGTAQSILSWYRLTAKNQPTEITVTGRVDAILILWPRFWGPQRHEQTEPAVAATSSSSPPGFSQSCWPPGALAESPTVGMAAGLSPAWPGTRGSCCRHRTLGLGGIMIQPERCPHAVSPQVPPPKPNHVDKQLVCGHSQNHASHCY